MPRIAIVVGTRPEIIKMAPVVRALQKRQHDFIFIHSGQHHDYNLSQKFIEELELPEPHYVLRSRTTLPGRQVGEALIALERLLAREKTDTLLVEGDTNTVLAAALAGNKQNVPVGHVEAGLRSFDLRMPEEHNRRLVDHVSKYLFAPTKTAANNLRREHVWGKIYVVGNTVIDACIQHLPIAKRKSKIMKTVTFSRYALATIHRQENVDDSRVLRNIVDAFNESPIPIVLPLHPRTKKRLRQFHLNDKIASDNIQILPPVGYLDFLLLMKNCDHILTDSGGIQEEATAPPIRKRVLVLRLSTERPEAVKAGFVKVVGVKKREILEGIERALVKQAPHVPSPYGRGRSSQKILRILETELWSN